MSVFRRLRIKRSLRGGYVRIQGDGILRMGSGFPVGPAPTKPLEGGFFTHSSDDFRNEVRRAMLSDHIMQDAEHASRTPATKAAAPFVELGRAVQANGTWTRRPRVVSPW